MESRNGPWRWIARKFFSTSLIIISTYCICSVSKQTEDVVPPTTLQTKQENLHSLDNGSASVPSTRENHSSTRASTDDGIMGKCPSKVECNKLGGECLDCKFNKSCIYYNQVNVSCSPKKGINCLGPKEFDKTTICRFCYQTEKWEHSCTKNSTCRVVSAPRARYIANCTVKSEIVCMGSRTFSKNLLCNWTAGYRWSTTLILSITLGGFGADRFYLGHWQEGIGKLFSFGGLGVWTLVDVILVAIGYLGPIDGSLYICWDGFYINNAFLKDTAGKKTK